MGELNNTPEESSGSRGIPPHGGSAHSTASPSEEGYRTPDAPTQFEKLQKTFLRSLLRKDWEALDKSVDAIFKNGDLSPPEISAILNSRLPRSGMTALHVFSCTNAPVNLLKKVIAGGADLSATCGARKKDEDVIFSECSPLHLAFSNGHYLKAVALIDAGHPLDILNGEKEDPVSMMLKHTTIGPQQEERAVRALQHYYRSGGFIGQRDADNRLALSHAVKGEKWRIAQALADEHLREKHTATTVPVRKSEVQSNAVVASLRMQEPEELVAKLALLAEKAVDEELWPTPPEQLEWTRILLDYVPGSNKQISSWEPYERVLNELEENTELFDEDVRRALLNPRVEPKVFPVEFNPKHTGIYEALGLLDPDHGNPPTLLHVLVDKNAPLEIFKKSIELGADVTEPASVKVTDRGGVATILSDQTVIHQVAALGRAEMIQALAASGADLNIPDELGETPLHRFLEHNVVDALNLRDLHKMLEAGANPDITNNRDLDSFHLAERQKYRFLLPLLFRYSAKESTDPTSSTSNATYKIYLKGEAITVTHQELVEELQRLRAESGPKKSLHGGYGYAPTYGDYNSGSSAEELETLKEVGLFDEMKKSGEFKAGLGLSSSHGHYLDTDLFRSLEHPYQAYLFLKSMRENSTGKSAPEYAFTKLLPRLLFNHSVELSHPLARLLEALMDSNRRRGVNQSHPNAVELMALLNHPRDEKRDANSIGAMTSALTSITFFAGAGKVATTGIADVWGKIGTYGFNGIIWRFDAERIKGVDEKGKRKVETPSLLERYGAYPLAPNAYERSNVFGPSFVVVPGGKLSKRITENTNGLFAGKARFDRDTFIEMHRGCFVVSHPEDGTLVIRNSSPVFGRDLLDEPAYFSPMGVSRFEKLFHFTVKDLIQITPKAIANPENHFQSILSKDLYPVRRYRHEMMREDSSSYDSLPAIRRLWERLHTFRTDFSRWKFDTKRSTAWAHNPESDQVELVGGHHSPGFPAVIDYLEGKFRDYQTDMMFNGESKIIVPDLAFIHPEFAPFSPYVRMRASEESLSVMRKLAEGTPLTQREMDESQIHEFFDIGFREDADLVLLAPEKRY